MPRELKQGMPDMHMPDRAEKTKFIKKHRVCSTEIY